MPLTSIAQKVKYLGIEQGLSNNAVTCITQDQYGFMWMGTYDGLNRYDGYQFKIFRNLWGDGKSLTNNHIKSVFAHGNSIYVGTQKGLMYYCYTDAQFHNLYYKKQGSRQPVKVSSGINQIIGDGLGNTYVATENAGLLVFRKSDTVATQVPQKTTYSYSVQGITLDNNNGLWLFINGVGLCRYKLGAEMKVEADVRFSANCLVADGAGSIWIGTDNGLYTFNVASHAIDRFDTVIKLNSANIFNLFFTKQRELWILTNGGGINIWNIAQRKLSALLPGETDHSLRSGAITSGFEDNEGRKWITTLRGGVNIIDNKEIPFHLYTHDAFNKNSVINNFVQAFCEDEKHNVWIGTDGGGLSYWDRQANHFTGFTHQPGTASLSSNFVVSILKDHTNRIWIATFSGGIDAFDNATKEFKHYSCFDPSSQKEEKNFWKLFEDAQHNIWAGSTWGGALYKFNPEKNRFDLFDDQLRNIHTIYQSHDNKLWAGDYSNLINIDPVSHRNKAFTIGQPLRAIVEDAAHHLWVGTEGGGLIKFNTANNTFKRYTAADGLPGNSILNILVDNRDNLWCSTYNGLSKFDQKTGKISNYYASDGLQSNQFSYNAALKLNSGEMLFGGLKGFNSFFPDSIRSYVHEPRLQLTDFRVNNSSIEGSHTYSGNKPLYEVKNITIPYNQATITVNYTALEYSCPEKISYAYYLEKWDHNWNYVGKLKTAYYTRLNEGTYTLRIKATNTEGVWTKKELVVLITVLPPWYRAWWAYLFYIVILGSVTYAFWLYRIRQTRLKYEVQIANLKVEKEKEVNEKKLSFFTNVSHEFRTPLTLIINPIKDLLKSDKEHAEELNIVYRNARRLLGLVDHLLLFRKTESESAELKLSKVNFTDLSRDVYTCFIHQAKIKQINYVFESEQDLVELYLDREKIEISLFNLISNALKFTPDGGHIHITIRQSEEMVYFEIADSGIGINVDVGEKLFDKFYQIKDTTSLKTGFGIGLYLVKTFIAHHFGTINYTSNANGGTTFTLCLPRGKAHFGNQPILESASQGYSYAVEELIDHNNHESHTGEVATDDLALLISDRQSIMVIDDNQEIRTYIKKIFQADYVIYEAGDGQIGLELIRQKLPDVIISDIVMPGLSGLELCKTIKQDSALSHIPIILLTGESEPSIRLQGIKEGAVDFVNKPFDKELLVARVRSIIRNKSELQNYFYSEITLKGKNRNVSEENKEFLYKCIDIIENQLLDPELDVNVIADRIGMSHSSLYKRIKSVTGQSLSAFIRFVRLRKAAELMINTNCNVNEAAFQTGFNDMKYFREQFNKQFGLNPSDFIKRHRAAFQKSYTLKHNLV
ncbi:hybrid sensor histidine kinase/response regulator transcription factor [Mucilaginibacter agri]|uniref:histidine kinase n=1 Tax=Mucilaginibacter agri TaxID=2695265 RepID=A0A965ZBS3_9SPHI|nr:two-component regulator propeller domain-containing protein [Mucilaginibacter agri]NCD68119.1 response regulator [Mucilaginibacter agri]